jgi:hypothetical protein
MKTLINKAILEDHDPLVEPLAYTPQVTRPEMPIDYNFTAEEKAVVKTTLAVRRAYVAVCRQFENSLTHTGGKYKDLLFAPDALRETNGNHPYAVYDSGCTAVAVTTPYLKLWDIVYFTSPRSSSTKEILVFGGTMTKYFHCYIPYKISADFDCVTECLALESDTCSPMLLGRGLWKNTLDSHISRDPSTGKAIDILKLSYQTAHRGKLQTDVQMVIDEGLLLVPLYQDQEQIDKAKITLTKRGGKITFDNETKNYNIEGRLKVNVPTKKATASVPKSPAKTSAPSKHSMCSVVTPKDLVKDSSLTCSTRKRSTSLTSTSPTRQSTRTSSATLRSLSVPSKASREKSSTSGLRPSD